MNELGHMLSVAYRMLAIEAFLVITCAFIFFIFYNVIDAISIILGGFAFILPNLVFTWWSLKMTHSSKLVLYRFYLAEGFKWSLTIAMFVIIVLVMPSNIGIAMVTYVIMHITNIIGLGYLTR